MSGLEAAAGNSTVVKDSPTSSLVGRLSTPLPGSITIALNNVGSGVTAVSFRNLCLSLVVVVHKLFKHYLNTNCPIFVIFCDHHKYLLAVQVRLLCLKSAKRIGDLFLSRGILGDGFVICN